jgi:ribosomal protein S18 acetylase RimI-like enzyme
MIIRHARPEDFERIAEIQIKSWRDVYAGVLSRQYLEHEIEDDLKRHWLEMELQPEDMVLVAEDNGILGFILVWCRPDAYIEHLHVTPSARGRGIGAELLREAARLLLAKGRRSVYLWVVEANPRALKFYERMGGAPTTRQTNQLHGNSTKVIKVEWPELSVLAGES